VVDVADATDAGNLAYCSAVLRGQLFTELTPFFLCISRFAFYTALFYVCSRGYELYMESYHE